MGVRSVHQLYPSKSLTLKGPFEVASFDNSVLERPFNMMAMIFIPKSLSEGDIYNLEHTDRCVSDSEQKQNN